MMFALLSTACGSKTIVKTEYIYPIVNIPEEPMYYNVYWKKIDDKYCLDIDNAKFLLKNYHIIKTYKDELKLILTNIKEFKKEEDEKK